MDGFFGDVLIACIPILIILPAVYLPVIKGRTKTIKRQEQKIAEYKQRIDALAAESEKREKFLKDLQETLLSQFRETKRLRSELQKRTEQYNDLVDLARERGIIGE